MRPKVRQMKVMPGIGGKLHHAGLYMLRRYSEINNLWQGQCIVKFTLIVVSTSTGSPFSR